MTMQDIEYRAFGIGFTYGIVMGFLAGSSVGVVLYLCL